MTIVNIMKRYAVGEKGVYFSFVDVERGEDTLSDIENESDEDIAALITENDGEVKMSAIGPFGHFGMLNDVDIFRDIAEAAPNAYFSAEIDGNTTYTTQHLECELKDRMLHIETFFLNNDEETDSYVRYFKSKLPYRKFIKLFGIDADDFDDE